MLICPQCNHKNPEGATLCETCYTPLPLKSQCPQCGSEIISTANVCGQCGFILIENNLSENLMTSVEETTVEVSENETLEGEQEVPTSVVPEKVTIQNEESESESESESNEQEVLQFEIDEDMLNDLEFMDTELETPSNITENSETKIPATTIQTKRAILFHVQTEKEIELPPHLPVIHLGKENETIPPDIDVSGFPDSQYVSRIHADIRVEADDFYIEDVGSANGTYINHTPLPKGNRHRLRTGDRIALGKEDKVSFIFKLL